MIHSTTHPASHAIGVRISIEPTEKVTGAPRFVLALASVNTHASVPKKKNRIRMDETKFADNPSMPVESSPK